MIKDFNQMEGKKCYIVVKKIKCRSKSKLRETGTNVAR